MYIIRDNHRLDDEIDIVIIVINQCEKPSDEPLSNERTEVRFPPFPLKFQIYVVSMLCFFFKFYYRESFFLFHVDVTIQFYTRRGNGF